MYFAIRVAVGSAIMLAFYLTRGFGSLPETFVMALGASLAAQGAAFAVKLIVGDQPRSRRAALLLAGCVIAVAGSVVFVVIDKQHVVAHTRVRGLLDMPSVRRDGDDLELTLIDGPRRIPIRYRGVLPDQVRDRAEVVATGQWHGEVFVATELMAKCPDSYEPPKARPDTRYR